MGRRRKESGLDMLASMPWPVGIVAGVVAFLAMRYGIGLYFREAGGAMLRPVGEQMLGGMSEPLAWMVLVLCWIAAAVSFFRGRSRKRLLDIQESLDTLSAMDWREFEMLVGEAYRRQGYAVDETGLGGADGGVDLVLRKNGRTELVQCKQWRNRQVRAAVVREMWGLVAHHQADGVKIVGIGDFTPDAAAFARGKAIDLVNGEQLLAMVREIQTSRSDPEGLPAAHAAPSSPAVSQSPACPTCAGQMVRRNNRRTQQAFWGCTAYPKCRGTRPA